eukprot:12922288-Ditylum_brightwellii.AAC.1
MAGLREERAQKEGNNVSREEAASPTAPIKLVILTSIIDAKEESYVVTINIPGAYLNTNMEDE